jgi:uncharacterized protein YjdB
MLANKKGLTMIEIVVAVGLLGIIAVLFLTAFSGQFAMFAKTSQITDKLFQSQEAIEKDIEDIKAKLAANPSSITNENVSYTLFSGAYRRSVSGYVSDTDLFSEDTRLVAVVSDARLPSFPTPEVISLDLEIVRNGTDPISGLDNFENVSFSGLTLRANSTIDENGVYYTSRHEWYVSNPGFNIPVIPKDNPDYATLVNEDFDRGRLYPVYPNDYSPVPVYAYSGMSSESILAALTETYAGRHIVYKVTPYAVSGRMGDPAVSDPVFLTGPSVTSGRILHLDASLISKADYGSSTSSLLALNSNQVKRWNDKSGLDNHAQQNSEVLMPRAAEVNYSTVSSVWGKSLSGESSGSELSISSFDSAGALSDYTLIVTAKRLNNSSYDFLTAKNGSGDTWKIGFVDGDIVFDATASNAANVPAIRNISADDSWHIFVFDIKADGTVSVYIDDETSPSAVGTIAAGHAINAFDINLNDSFEMAELIMYRSLSDGNKTKVRNFQNDKYNPDPAEHAVTINYLLPVAEQVLLKGDPGSGLPGSAQVHMSNGSVQSVAIAWDGGYDPNTVGTYSVTANAIMDSTKTVTTTVHVLGVDELQLNPSVVSIVEGTDYPLPVRLPAIVSNASMSRTMDVVVNWFDISTGLPGSAISNLSVLGGSVTPYIVRAYADADNTKFIDLSVNVEAHVPVTGVFITPSAITINLDASETLTATVQPALATNKGITWETSHPNHVSITDTGVPGTIQIKGLNPGGSINPVRSTITVSSDEGGFTASCVVTVHIPLTGLSFSQPTTGMTVNSTGTVANLLRFTPENATNKNVTWSSNNSIASVNENTGVISTGNTNGTARITAASVENPTKTAWIDVSVTGGCDW